ncbi:TPA: fimbrial protein [Salmonella enterica subsp. enterica serovar Saintpaul]
MKKIMHKRRLSLWAGVMLLLVPVLYSGAARALPYGCQTGTTYTGDKGAEAKNLPLVPQVITLNKDTPVNQVIYEKELPSIQYVCNTSSTNMQPTIQGGFGFFNNLVPELDKAGLKIQYIINKSAPFTPERTNSLPIDSYSQAGINVKTLAGKFQLILERKIDKPVNMVIPAINDILNLTYGRKGTNYISFGTSNATKVYYVPQCIGKVSVPAVVDLGRVITGGKGSLPSPRNFYINTSFNHDCAGFNDISAWGGFSLTLEIKFSAAGADDKTTSSSLILYNDDGQKNGLQLVIKEAGSKTVTFGKWSPVSPAITPNDLPLNLFYTASLEPTGSVTSAVTGKFSQNVTVKVRYQ